MSNNSAITLQGNGSVMMMQRASANGSTVTQLTGHWIVFMFPTDTPQGPSTTLYTGKVTLSNDASFNTTLLSQAGKSLDICAALST